MTDTFQAQLDSPIGVLTLVASDEGLRKILWEDQAEQAGDATVAESHPVLTAASAQLTEYFAGDRAEFDLPLDLIGTDFQKAAWLALADVPYGETRSYGEQAECIGRTGAFRAVGAAATGRVREARATAPSDPIVRPNSWRLVLMSCSCRRGWSSGATATPC